MSEISSVELEHCKELAMPPGCLFEVSSRFINSEQRDQLLAIYALNQSIASIPLIVADDTVKWTKLKWWSEELCAEATAPERHPVLRALQHSGARSYIDNAVLLQLVSDAVALIDAFPDADSQGLLEKLGRIGETDILLQAALGDVTIGEPLLQSMSIGTGVYWLVSLLLNDYVNHIQLLPLAWLAEFKVKPDELKVRPPATALISMMKRLAQLGADSFTSGLANDEAGQLKQVPLHLRLSWSLQSRALKRVALHPHRYFNRKSAYGLSDVWFAWKYCRRRLM